MISSRWPRPVPYHSSIASKQSLTSVSPWFFILSCVNPVFFYKFSNPLSTASSHSLAGARSQTVRKFASVLKYIDGSTCFSMHEFYIMNGERRMVNIALHKFHLTWSTHLSASPLMLLWHIWALMFYTNSLSPTGHVLERLSLDCPQGFGTELCFSAKF